MNYLGLATAVGSALLAALPNILPFIPQPYGAIIGAVLGSLATVAHLYAPSPATK